MTGAAGTRPEDILWHEGPAAYLSSEQPATGPAASGRPADQRSAWLLGVALGAVGRYAEAGAVLTVLETSLALSTLASHARQVGRHPEAAVFDRRARGRASSAEDRSDAVSGLVADALGQGEAAAAVALLPAARAAAYGWRGTTRLHWVAAELALLRDLPSEAVAEAEQALRAAEGAAAPRHVTKSLLVRGVARKAAGDPAGARADVADALRRAEADGLVTLAWPAALVCAELDPGFAGRARLPLQAVVRGLGEQGPAFAARPDIAAALGDADKIG